MHIAVLLEKFQELALALLIVATLVCNFRNDHTIIILTYLISMFTC